MSTRTTYYNLTKPDAGEHVLRTVINQNYDAIDLQMHANAQAAEEAAHISADEYDENASYIKGDFCIYENTLYKANKNTTGPFTAADWDATTIADAFEPKHTWSLYETITADGTERFLYSSELPENVSGIIISNVTQAGANAWVLGMGATFDGTNWETVGGISNGINTDVRYSRFYYIKDGNLWYSRSTSALSQTNATGSISERYEAFTIGGTVKQVRVFAPSGATMPSGSTFEIYIRQ